MGVKTLLRSFAGGEIAPELFGRIDLDKYQTGLAACRNFVTLPHGPVRNRQGFKYILECKDSTKAVNLIEFSYSTLQTYVLEFGDYYVRFHTGGATLLETPKTIGSIAGAVVTLNAHGFTAGRWVYIGTRYYKILSVTTNTFTLRNLDDTTPASVTGATAAQVYEIATPYPAADVMDLHYVQSADVLTIVHPSYEPRELRRLAAANWTLTTIAFAPVVNGPASVTNTATVGSGTTTYRYAVTAVAEDSLEESVVTLAYGPTLNISAITKANPAVLTTSAAHGLAVNDRVYIASVGGMTQLTAGFYLVNTVPSTTTLTLKTLGGTVLNSTSWGTYSGGGTLNLYGVKNNIATSGNTNTISWSEVSGSVRYNVYKERNGLFGYIGQTDETTFVDDNIIADVTRTPPTADNPFAGTGNYPAAVSYFEQRRCFAGTNNQPQNLWMTRSATESNMNYSVPTQDDDAITLKIAAREVNRVRHIVPLADLILLTTSGEWRVWAQNSDAITPTTVSVRPQSYNGSANVQPVVTGNSTIYVRNQSSRLHELSYNWESNAYRSEDISIMAPHLFDEYAVTDMTVTKTPVPIVWCSRSDGTLLGMTYMPSQKVWAWHKHDTDGFFESVAAVSENDVDVLYAVVRRTVNGRTVRYVERLELSATDTLENSFHVDSGLTYSGSPATTISGLWHLEGKTVSVLTDGAVHPQRTVTNGQITLQEAASKVHVGLPITADVQTLPISLEAEAFAQGRNKNVNTVYLRVLRSSGIKVGPAFTKLTEYKQRTNEVYGEPPELISEEIHLDITPTWSDSGQICVRQSDPLPLSILSMVIEVALGG